MKRTVDRNGYALMLTLYAIVILSVGGVAIASLGREAFDVSRNRYAAERARWRADGCIATARAEIDGILHDSSAAVATRFWRSPALAFSHGEFAGECEVTATAAGDRVDVNAATAEQLARALNVLDPAHALQMADALMDWRDSDDEVQPLGAEREWYAANHRRPPRNGAIASMSELSRVRGFELVPDLGQLFDVEPGRIALNSAPAAVLASIPGLTTHAIDRIVQYREEGRQVDDVLALTTIVPAADLDSIMARYADIAHMAVADPDAWIVTAIARDGAPAIAAECEVRIVRQRAKAIVVRHRCRS